MAGPEGPPSPRRPRWCRPSGEGAELPVVGVILFAIAALLVAVLAVALVIPALIFVVEMALVLAAVGLGVLGRVLFRRPWPSRHV